MEIRWDSGRTSSFDASERRHVDYGCGVTSHSRQGQTAGRVLVHVETDCARETVRAQRLRARRPSLQFSTSPERDGMRILRNQPATNYRESFGRGAAT
jgi:hypothetical protein